MTLQGARMGAITAAAAALAARVAAAVWDDKGVVRRPSRLSAEAVIAHRGGDGLGEAALRAREETLLHSGRRPSPCHHGGCDRVHWGCCAQGLVSMRRAVADSFALV